MLILTAPQAAGEVVAALDSIVLFLGLIPGEWQAAGSGCHERGYEIFEAKGD